MYYNTTNLTGSVLRKSINNAKSQYKKVKIILQQSPYSSHTPEDVWEKYFKGNNIPLTSIRRAFSVLQKDGIIFKQSYMVPGKYGKKIHTWRVR